MTRQLMKIGRKQKSLLERFNEKWVPEPNTGCWLWTSDIIKDGYGRIYISHQNKKPVTDLAHRVSWKIYRGKIPNDLHVLHKCDTPACVNPDHLFLGTASENMIDMHGKGRHGKRKLTASDVLQIRKLLKEAIIEQQNIAKLYDVSDATISLIKSGKTWAHVE